MYFDSKYRKFGIIISDECESTTETRDSAIKNTKIFSILGYKVLNIETLSFEDVYIGDEDIEFEAFHLGSRDYDSLIDVDFSTCEVADLGLENLPKYVNNLASITGYAKKKLCVITRKDGSKQYRIVSRDTGGDYSESHKLASAFYNYGVPSKRVVDKDRWYSAKIKGNLTVPVYSTN